MTNCFREIGRTLVFLPPLVAGCGSSGPNLMPVYPVTGSVFVEGEAAKGAVVMFHPLPIQTGRFDMIRSRGTANENGRFQLTTYQTDDGAPEGEYAVTIYWPGKRTERPDPNHENSDLPPDRLGLRYNDPATSKIRVQVTGPETSLESFDLD